METTVMNVAVSHGIWAVLAVFLLVYIVKSNEKRDEKQEEREKNYQSVIEKLTEKLEILHQVQSDLSEIKEKLLTSAPSVILLLLMLIKKYKFAEFTTNVCII